MSLVIFVCFSLTIFNSVQGLLLIPIKLYTELGCKFILDERPMDGPLNPEIPSYDCSHIESRRNEEKCYFKGKQYELGDRIDDSLIRDTCKEFCRCIKDVSIGRTIFFCEEQQCDIKVNHNRTDCVLKYDLNNCCPVEEICDNRTECIVNNHVYQEGERFDSNLKRCTTCVCTKNGKVCEEKRCNFELISGREILDFCAPSYRTHSDCCPELWICPIANIKDEIVREEINPREKDKVCKFGENFFNINDHFLRTNPKTGKKVQCRCTLPPYLTCIHEEGYTNDN